MKQWQKWQEEASGGSLIGSFVCVVIMGVVFWSLAPVVDKLVGVTNALMAVLPLSQDAANTIYTIAWVFGVIPFIYLLAVLINYVVTSMDESGGSV